MTADKPVAPPSTLHRIVGTTIAVVICNAVGILGALSTSTDSAWYEALARPSWQPPGWLFGPVWTLLYTLMGVALYRIYERRANRGARAALILFAVQLLLNGTWSPVFFAAQAIKVALVIIVLMVAMIALTTRRFWSVDRTSGALLLPYLAWVSFATILNATIVALN